MKITSFDKTIDIDENNKGIRFYFDNIGTPINEVSIVNWYRIRDDLTTNEAAENLRKMSPEQLKETILQNIRDAIIFYEFEEKYANYV